MEGITLSATGVFVVLTIAQVAHFFYCRWAYASRTKLSDENTQNNLQQNRLVNLEATDKNVIDCLNQVIKTVNEIVKAKQP